MIFSSNFLLYQRVLLGVTDDLHTTCNFGICDRQNQVVFMQMRFTAIICCPQILWQKNSKSCKICCKDIIKINEISRKIS